MQPAAGPSLISYRREIKANAEIRNHQPYHIHIRTVLIAYKPSWPKTFSRRHPLVSTWPPASESGLALEGLLGIGRLLGKLHQSHFGSIFLRVVDKLAIVPIAGSYVSTLDGDSTGPGGAPS